MKTTKYGMMMLIFLVVVTFHSTAQNQSAKTPDERAAALTAWMKTNLQLTPAQEAPVQTLNLKYAKMNEELKTSTASQQDKFKTLKSNEQAKETELKGILTADQLKLYDAKKAEMREKFREERTRNN